MYYCTDCEHSFEELKKVCVHGQEECVVCVEQFGVCPYCGSENTHFQQED
ncbi:hypothetical protein LCGC14_0878040 [marine sediment metagenome]|uniref:Uncharacterized protein n=1 Tax=marine sediment metagenome TaxID=412755 RepID=A0A0F9PNB6_9ZZZZ